jgi:hypothetical protein
VSTMQQASTGSNAYKSLNACLNPGPASGVQRDEQERIGVEQQTFAKVSEAIPSEHVLDSQYVDSVKVVDAKGAQIYN